MESVKTCSKCGRVLPTSEFYSHKEHTDGLRSECKECTKRQNQDRYHQIVKRDVALVEKARQRGRDWYRANAKRSNARVSATHRAQREACIAAYGGKCECCGETHFEFLSLHHRNGGGYQQRKQIGGKMARWLAQNGFPQDVDIGILCHNCNSALGFYGYCPHQRET